MCQYKRRAHEGEKKVPKKMLRTEKKMCVLSLRAK